MRDTTRVLQPGQTCWRIARAARLAYLIDAKSYFDALDVALTKAERRIAIVGWDFDSRISLRPDAPPPARQPLGERLRRLVETRDGLEIFILVWRNSLFYGKNADLPLPFADAWWSHPRIRLTLDDHHPVSASHHQKIVTLDGRLAFVGGMDLTQCRWDDSRHLPEHPLRRDVAGKIYTPIHDVHAVLDGEAAAALHELASLRWQYKTGAPLPTDAAPHAPWPEHVRPVLRDHAVAIARTQPALDAQPEAREIERLNLSMLRAAKRSIYIEQQYFAEPRTAEILAEHLRRPDGPDVVLVVQRESHGVVEQYVMAENRDRLLAGLRKADRHGRLRACYPAVANGDGRQDIGIHSKVLVIDDRLLRLGSSNMNSRSLGLDTECDIAIDAENDAARRAVAGLRDALLGEHLGCSPQRFALACRRHGSLVAAIDELNGGERRLVPYPIDPTLEDAPLAPGTALLDPSKPIEIGDLFDVLKPSPSAE